MRKCEQCHGPGPCLYDYEGQDYRCRECSSTPDDPFFLGVEAGDGCKKCSYDPKPLLGQPIGQFHCPECGEMVLAGMEHPDYSLLDESAPLKPEWSSLINQRDEKGNLTSLALALDAIADNGCDCPEDEPGTCLACRCELALKALWDALHEVKQR